MEKDRRFAPGTAHFAKPYVENAWRIPLTDLPQAVAPIVVEVHFQDSGAGVIAATLEGGGKSISAARQCSYTRCNTGTERFAAFEFALPAQTAAPSC